MVCTENFKIMQCSSRFNFGDQDCETKITKFRQVDYCLIRITLQCLIFLFSFYFQELIIIIVDDGRQTRELKFAEIFTGKRKIYTLDTTVLLTPTQ